MVEFSSVFGQDLETHSPVRIVQSARRQGLYIIGVNGTGKSTLIANLIHQDMVQGLGVCLLDPHGDLTLDVLGRVPEERLADVILLDLLDSRYPFGLN
jgi:late competence protein required for DNA uptake (superfamily II DNA/RNA helicase)